MAVGCGPRPFLRSGASWAARSAIRMSGFSCLTLGGIITSSRSSSRSAPVMSLRKVSGTRRTRIWVSSSTAVSANTAGIVSGPMSCFTALRSVFRITARRAWIFLHQTRTASLFFRQLIRSNGRRSTLSCISNRSHLLRRSLPTSFPQTSLELIRTGGCIISSTASGSLLLPNHLDRKVRGSRSRNSQIGGPRPHLGWHHAYVPFKGWHTGNRSKVHGEI